MYIPSDLGAEYAQCSVPSHNHHSYTHICSLRDGLRSPRSPCELHVHGINELLMEAQRDNLTWIAKGVEKAEGEV